MHQQDASATAAPPAAAQPQVTGPTEISEAATVSDHGQPGEPAFSDVFVVPCTGCLTTEMQSLTRAAINICTSGTALVKELKSVPWLLQISAGACWRR